MQAVADTQEIAEVVLAQRVDHLYENTPVGQIANVLCAGSLVVLEWQQFPKSVLLGWLAAAVASSLARYGLVLLYRRRKGNASEWIVRYRISIVMSGLVWGTAGVLLFPADSPIHQAYLVLILILIASGGVALYSAVPGIMYWYLVPAMVPFVFSLVSHGQSETYVMAVLLVMIFTASMKLNRDMQEVYSQAFNAAEHLRREKDIALHATREKDNYVSLIAHDLKSPFSSLIQLLGIFDSESQPLDEERRAMLRSMRRRCEDSVATIDGVLHASRFTNAGISLKRNFLNAHMEALRAVVNFKHQAETKGIQIVNEVPEGMRIYADSQLFGEVLQNLVSNAVKFCRKGDRITLFAPPSEPATLAVRDTGIGIDPELLPGLFRKDVKTTRLGTLGEKGTGFGLPICKEIMQTHGGDLEVESTPGKGTVMYVRLPTMKPLVLVVDDDQAVRFALRKQLTAEQFAVEEANHGEAAIKKVADLKPHLVLLDIFLPGMDGFAVLKRLKADPAALDVPVIVTTSDSRMETRKKALDQGAADFLTKPIRVEDLVPRVLKSLS